jgi:hypothetical protein
MADSQVFQILVQQPMSLGMLSQDLGKSSQQVLSILLYQGNSPKYVSFSSTL